jgi:TonB family protein
MNRSSGIAVFGALAIAVANVAPAAAQYQNEYVPPKLLTRGTTSSAISGNGTVVVQVQVNPDGSHKAIRVIRSTNVADNQAALDIAQSSTYSPGTRGGKAGTFFYDYTLKFSGSSVAADTGGSQAMQITRMNRAGNYSGAKAQATEYLSSHPGDAEVTQQLGIANFFLKDYQGSAAAFAQVPNIDHNYRVMAAAALANAAVDTSNPELAVSYAQKANSLDPGANSLFALGVAQLANKDYAAAASSLSKARALAFSSPKTDTKTKLGIDGRLLAAYQGANDTANVQKIANEIKQLDPSSNIAGRVAGNQYLSAGNAAVQAGNTEEALKQFELAAGTGDPDVQVTAYTQAAFAIGNSSKPDYDKMKSYADKALAVKATDPAANFAAGVALTGQWKTENKPDLKQQAVDFCNKAIQYAQAANDQTGFVSKVQAFMKEYLK